MLSRTALFLATLLTGCSAAVPSPADPDGGVPNGDASADASHSPCTGRAPSFANDVTPVLAGCAGGEMCHGGLRTRGWSYEQLVNVPSTRDSCSPGMLVTPGDVENSYLVHKLRGTGMCPDSQRMPPYAPLADGEIQIVVDWICAGAKND